MKRLIAALVVVSMIAAFAASPAVFAEETFETVASENFEQELLPESIEVSVTEAAADDEAGAEDIFKNKVIKFPGSSSGYAKMTYSFSAIKPAEQPANTYAEIEFDMKSDAREVGGNITVSFGNKMGSVFFALVKSGTKLHHGDGSGKPLLAETSAMVSDWHNYRFVFSITDANGERQNKLAALYIDGESVSLNPDELVFGTADYAALNSLTFGHSKKNGEFALWADNIAVRKYSSENGISPIPDKKALKADVLSLYEKLESKKADLSDENYKALSERIKALFDVCMDFSAVSSAVSAAESEAELISSDIDELSKPEPPVGSEIIAGFDFNAAGSLPEGFKDTSNIPLASADTDKFSADRFHKGALKLLGSREAYSYLRYDFAPIEANGKNLYAETEFDLYTENLAVAGTHVVLTFGSKVKSLKIQSSSKGGITVEDSNAAKLAEAAYKDSAWTNYRFVMQLTDETGAKVNRIAKIYVNGEDTTLPVSAENNFTNADAKYSSVVFQLNKKQADGYALWLDNFYVRKYSSENGESPFPVKLGLKEKISDAEKLLSAGSSKISAEKLEEFKAELEALLGIYESSSLTAESVADALTRAENLKAEIEKEINSSSGDVSDYTQNGFYGFEGNDESNSISVSKGIYEIIDDYADDVFLGKVLHFSTANDTFYPEMEFGFDAVPASAEGGAAPGTYAELAFDIKTDMASGKNLTFKLLPKSGKALAELVLKGTVLYQGSIKIADIPSGEFVNVKMVFQMTDLSGANVKKLAGLYVNGENVIKSQATLGAGDSFARLDLTMSKKSNAGDDNFGVYIDNIDFLSYVSADGKSCAPNRGYLEISGRSALENLEGSFSDYARYAEFKDKIFAAAEVYKNPGSNGEEIKAAADEIKDIFVLLSGLSETRKSGKKYYITDAETDAESLLGRDNAKISFSIVSGEKAPFECAAAAVVYGASDIAENGRVLDIISKNISVSAGSLEKAVIDIDLSGYSNYEKKNMYVRFFVFDNFEDLSIINGTGETFFGELKNIDKSLYNFSSEVNASLKIIDGSNQKLVITANGKAASKGKKVSVLMLKKGISFSSAAGGINNVEYIESASLDENGYVAFEIIPRGGIGEYEFKVCSEAFSKEFVSKVTYTDENTINAAFDAIYANKTAAVLKQNASSLYIDISALNEAESCGADVSGIISSVLSEKRYDASTVGEFSESFSKNLDLVCGIRTAQTVDNIEDIITKLKELVSNYSLLGSLTYAQKRAAFEYMLNNKLTAADLEGINSLVAKAAAEALANTPAPTPGGGSGGGSGGGGGGTSGGYAKVGTPEAKGDAPAEKMSAAFSDLEDFEWAKQAISSLAAINCISGKAEGIFAPNDSITREEFVKIAVVAFGMYKEGAKTSFADVPEEGWFFSYVASAVDAGIISGIDEKNFGTGQLIKREDMAVIIYRAMVKLGAKLTEDGVYIEFNDEFKFSDYAFEAVRELTKSGIVNGTDTNEFMPDANSTRAEAAKMLYEAYTRL